MRDFFFVNATEAGNTVEPARSVNPRRVEASPYIQELLSPFAAVSMRVVLRGQSCFYHNDVCARLFLSTEEANELYATKNKARLPSCRGCSQAATAAQR